MGNLCSSPIDYFDFEYYKRANPLVAKTYEDDIDKLWHHWVHYGFAECRPHRFLVYIAAAQEKCVPCQPCCQCDPPKITYPDSSVGTHPYVKPKELRCRGGMHTDGYVVKAPVLLDGLTLSTQDFLDKYEITVPHEVSLATALLNCLNDAPGFPMTQ